MNSGGTSLKSCSSKIADWEFSRRNMALTLFFSMLFIMGFLFHVMSALRFVVKVAPGALHRWTAIKLKRTYCIP